MNLKDVILSTISELENHEDTPLEESGQTSQAFKINAPTAPVLESAQVETADSSEIMEDRFLHDLRERILVLFEGFQSPNNAKIEAKVDLTLNFLEHLLAKIDIKLAEK